MHDTSHCLQWAVLDMEGFADLEREVTWLTGVLGSRGFALEHLAAISSSPVTSSATGGPLAERLRSAARTVRHRAQ